MSKTKGSSNFEKKIKATKSSRLHLRLSHNLNSKPTNQILKQASYPHQDQHPSLSPAPCLLMSLTFMISKLTTALLA